MRSGYPASWHDPNVRRRQKTVWYALVWIDHM